MDLELVISKVKLSIGPPFFSVIGSCSSNAVNEMSFVNKKLAGEFILGKCRHENRRAGARAGPSSQHQPRNQLEFTKSHSLIAEVIIKLYTLGISHKSLISKIELMVKVIRKYFLNHNKSFRLHLGDYENHNFFPFEGL